MTSVNRIEIKELDPDIIPPITARFNDPNYNGGCKLVVVGKPGCFALGTKVMMYDGNIKRVENVVVGDQLMGDDSTPRTVLELCNGKEMMYKITPIDGYTYTVNENHILSLKCRGTGEIIDITVKEYLTKSLFYQKRYKWYRNPIDFPEKEVGIDPYLLGYWLGDWLNDQSLSPVNVIDVFNAKLKEIEPFLSDSSAYKYQTYKEKIKKPSEDFLKQYNLFNNKYIPHVYKTNSREIRLKLLAGIIDSEECYDKKDNGYDIIQSNEILMDDIVFIARSLGFYTHKQRRVIRRIDNSEGIYFHCFIGGNIDDIPCCISHGKDGGIEDILRDDRRANEVNFGLERLEVDEYYGFVLDGNHRFLGEDFSVLHNTGKSTLIKALLHAKKHIFPVGIAMSGSEDSNYAYREIMPSSFVFNEYDEDKITQLIKRQKLAAAHLPNPWAVMILDDCTDDPRIFNKPLQQALYKKGRHWSLLYILSLQYAMDVKPVIRTNVDGIFILREPLLKNREALYKNYASIIPDFATFCTLMDSLTEDYCSLYIHGSTHTNTWQECVYYWKPPVVSKNWKLGCPEYWEFHNERYNEEYKDNVTGY